MAKKKQEHDFAEGIQELIDFYNENFEAPNYHVVEKKKYENLLRCGIYMDLMEKHELDDYAPEKVQEKFYAEYKKVCKDKGVPVEED
jgi:hypothetical protein